ncbi:hypothetical protein P7C71_g25, partial [Lecanoromycetidae sp. Uapishka_2]
MASRSNQDAWLWLGLAALGYYVAMTVHKQLVAVQQATEITPQETLPHKISQKTEDSIQIETLARVARNPNQDIKAAVLQIVTKRLLRKDDTDSAWGILMRDLSGWDFQRRDRALALLRYVHGSSQRFDYAELFNLPDISQRVVGCLRDMLPEARRAEVQSSYRSQPERDALWLLSVMAFDHQHALSVDVVGEWLAHYPFGGENTSDTEKQKIIKSIINRDPVYQDSDFGYSMRSVLVQLHGVQLYTDQLIDHGLLTPAYRSDLWTEAHVEHGSPSSFHTHEPDQFVRSSDDWDIPDLSPSPREIEQSPEEQALRRRRREAMVYSESGRPISREDIIERDPAEDIVDEEAGEETERWRMENTLAEEASDRSWLGWLARLRPDGLAPLPTPANEW